MVIIMTNNLTLITTETFGDLLIDSSLVKYGLQTEDELKNFKRKTLFDQEPMKNWKEDKNEQIFSTNVPSY